jgi:hypothetical protein
MERDMEATKLLEMYGFERTGDDTWHIIRTHRGLEYGRDGAVGTIDLRDDIVVHQTGGEEWISTARDADGTALVWLKSNDVRDAVAFAQSVIVGSIMSANGEPPDDEGVSFNGTWYASPLISSESMWFDTDSDDKVAMPGGKYGKAYAEWRDDFADRIVNGIARAPAAHFDVPVTGLAN